jgi:hypothetical protein
MQVYDYDQRSRVVLDKLEPSFPNSWHYDPEHYRKELETFWYRMWINVCRSDEVASPRDYKVVSIGEQNIVVTRDLRGNLRAFHNTCRHRGSILCTQDEGRRNRLAAGLQGCQHWRSEPRPHEGPQGQTESVPQHVPAPWLDPVHARRGPVRGRFRGRLHRLPVPRVDVLAGREADRHAAPA